jgi:hypothetical protein
MPSEHLQEILKSFPSKRPAGRPTKRTPQLDDQICRMLAEGMSFKRIARELDLNPDTIFEWRRTSNSFFAITENARRRARKAGLVRWDRPADET